MIPRETRSLLMPVLEVVKVFGEAIEARFPELSVPLKPLGGCVERGGIYRALAPLRRRSPRNQTRALENLQAPRNRGQTDIKRLRQNIHRRVPVASRVRMVRREAVHWAISPPEPGPKRGS